MFVTYKQSKTVWNRVVLQGQFVYFILFSGEIIESLFS